MKALIAGSFDPITNGHLDIIARASKMFSEVFVVVGNNSAKKYTFDSKTRKRLVWAAVEGRGHKNVQVMEFDGLLAQFMYHHNINVLVRGVRNTSDFQEELTLSHVNKDIKGIETIFLPTSPELANVSSSMVKAIVKEFGDVQNYVPMEVKYELNRTVAYNTFIGVLGGIGTGKSTVCQLMTQMIREPSLFNSEDFKIRNGNASFHIPLDKLGHRILGGTEPYSLHVKEMLISYFGNEILSEDMSIDRKKLGSIVFPNPGKLAVLNEIMKKPLEHTLYEEIRTISRNFPEANRIFFIEGANLENGWLPFVDNHAIQITCNLDVRKRRIAARDKLSDEAIVDRIDAQINPNEQMRIIESVIGASRYGYVSQIDTSGTLDDLHILTQNQAKIIKSELI